MSNAFSSSSSSSRLFVFLLTLLDEADCDRAIRNRTAIRNRQPAFDEEHRRDRMQLFHLRQRQMDELEGPSFAVVPGARAENLLEIHHPSQIGQRLSHVAAIGA